MTSLRIFMALLVVAVAGWAQQESWEVTIEGRERWKDTGIVVEAGDLVRFEATGRLKFPDARNDTGPEGMGRGWRDLIAALPLNDHGRGALIGRVGDSEAARPFLIGEKRESRMIVGGKLWLGTNQNRGSSAQGSYTVVIERLARATGETQTYTGPLPAIRAGDWKQIPYRVVDPDGTEGDLVNFLMFGREDQIKNALLSMGWVIVDRTIKDTILRGGLGTLSRQAYLTIPMSPLMVFGRVQDYGWAHSDPVMTVAERHHFRMWKAPFTDTLGGEIWVGAGTHDVGFDRGQRLLMPLPLNLSLAARELALSQREALVEFGFELEPFGPDGSLALTAAPKYSLARKHDEMIIELCEELAQGRRPGDFSTMRKSLVEMVACKAAIKAHDPLSPEQIKDLLRLGETVPHTFTCPHGRPTTYRLAFTDLEKVFHRR